MSHQSVIDSGWVRHYAIRLADLEIWVVGGAVGASVISTRLLPISVAIIILFWSVRWIAIGYPTLRTPVDLAILFIVLILPITLWMTSLPQITRPQIYRLLSGIGLYYAIINWAISHQRLKILIAGTALLSIALSVLGLFSVQWSTGKVPFIPKSIYDFLPTLVSDVIHRNVMAGYLVYLLPCGLGVLIFAWSHLSKPFRVIILLSCLITSGIIILTQSRGAWIAFAFIFLFILGLRWRWGWIAIITFVIFSALTVNYFGISTILEAITADDTIAGLDGRLEIWSRAIYMIRDFPFTGVGMGTYGDIANVFYPFFLAAPNIVPHAHNIFLQVTVDLGIPGLIAWLAVLITVIFVAWKVYRHGQALKDGWISGLGAGLLASQFALIVHGLTDAVTWGMVRPAPLVWAIWGLAIAGWNVYGAGRVEELS
jgi:putative inorganic carbon (HCO3(-)) transporter